MPAVRCQVARTGPDVVDGVDNDSAPWQDVVPAQAPGCASHRPCRLPFLLPKVPTVAYMYVQVCTARRRRASSGLRALQLVADGASPVVHLWHRLCSLAWAARQWSVQVGPGHDAGGKPADNAE